MDHPWGRTAPGNPRSLDWGSCFRKQGGCMMIHFESLKRNLHIFVWAYFRLQWQIPSPKAYSQWRWLQIRPELSGRIPVHFNGNSLVQFRTSSNSFPMWTGLQAVRCKQGFGQSFLSVISCLFFFPEFTASASLASPFKGESSDAWPLNDLKAESMTGPVKSLSVRTIPQCQASSLFRARYGQLYGRGVNFRSSSRLTSTRWTESYLGKRTKG